MTGSPLVPVSFLIEDHLSLMEPLQLSRQDRGWCYQGEIYSPGSGPRGGSLVGGVAACSALSCTGLMGIPLLHL